MKTRLQLYKNSISKVKIKKPIVQLKIAKILINIIEIVKTK
jgi:hypothetical protein